MFIERIRKSIHDSGHQKGIAWFLLITGIFGSIYFTIPAYSLFQDSHDKAIQIHSLIENGFRSEELFYPGRIMDKNLEFFHLPHNLHLLNKGRLISAFPVSFAAISAPFYYLFGIYNLPYLSAIFALCVLILLRKYWRFDFFFLFVSFFCTFAWPLSLDFSENNLVMLISAIPLTLLFKGNPRTVRTFAAGAFLGVSVWFRLEGLIYSGCVLFFYIINLLYSNNIKYKNWKRFLFACLGFSIPFVSFCAWNWYDYGHPLGTRYLANAHGFQVSLGQRLDWIVNLTLFGPLKIGFFGYLPAASFLFPVLIFNFRKLSVNNRILFGSSFLFLVLVLITAPNDGFNNWGPRFFAPLIIPYTILVRRIWFYSIRSGRKKTKRFLTACFVYSFFLGLAGFGIQRGRSLHVKKFSPIIEFIDAKIWIYTDYLSFYTIGPHYLDKVTFTADSTEKILTILKRSPSYWKGQKIAFVQYDLSSVNAATEERMKKNSLGMEIVKPIVWDRKILIPKMQESLSEFEISKKGNYEIWSGFLK
ncbi:hypothetical protein EHQ12_12030 [Leptospira gomenensis]|uniref:Glycosyltransferase RgtA/B/C/D-like domain-containing protein n=1 Tax=Leptospira gomenensis TaxID=2484974 RepID=A0A5F1Y989_9LEPT|nr:hypothetical protein [Leptospira gomenensis]TGK32667.1 hypothetical protein EHQ17_11875 [Leptospira gomenensis]TGK36815.1 hypothetical protein EHQ12_12030 [Leptospira gomenensis]TGK39890.1 hypothetical protein EHQ07_19330 [Leptospira gomenensis]TGK58025.1 hypothetical protein EHQ13_14230 [Leptospira gomenensis]